jgi:hypothetical protein
MTELWRWCGLSDRKTQPGDWVHVNRGAGSPASIRYAVKLTHALGKIALLCFVDKDGLAD